MNSFSRTALLAALTFTLAQPAALSVPSARAGSPAASTAKTKKHKKHKKQKEVVLKGRHGTRARKPA